MAHVIYEKPFRYEGGYPGLRKLGSGKIVVENGDLRYAVGAGGRKDAIVIRGEHIVDVRQGVLKGIIDVSWTVEVDVARDDKESFTVTFAANGFTGVTDVEELLKAIETIRAEMSMSGPAVVVRTYKSDIEYQQDARRLAKHGYTVQSAAHQENRPGAARIATLGLGALVWRPKPSLVVTYRKEEAA